MSKTDKNSLEMENEYKLAKQLCNKRHEQISGKLRSLRFLGTLINSLNAKIAII